MPARSDPAPAAAGDCTPRLRRATEQDARELAVLIDISNNGGDGPDLTAAILNVLTPGSAVHHSHAIVAEAECMVVAAMVLNVVQPVDPALADPAHRPFEELKADRGGWIYIRNLAILPAWRGKGLAKMLVSMAEGLSVHVGAPGCCAIVHRSNTPMQRLLKGLEFSRGSSREMISSRGHEAGTLMDLWSRTAR